MDRVARTAPDDELLRLDRLGDDDVARVLAWRYSDEYASYDLDGSDRATLAEPGNDHLAVRRSAELIGYVCLGGEARVAGMIEVPALDDIGVGIRPDLTGRGESRRLMPAILAALDQWLGQVAFRAVIKSWNHRAQRAAEHAGFQIHGTHENRAGGWVLLIRQPHKDV
jgi:ribosomal-protein-alanine N-acetyltransferase